MKDWLGRILGKLFTTPVGFILLGLFFLLCIYKTCKGIYINARYHFKDTLSTILFWVIFIGSILLIAEFVKYIDKKRKKDK